MTGYLHPEYKGALSDLAMGERECMRITELRLAPINSETGSGKQQENQWIRDR